MNWKALISDGAEPAGLVALRMLTAGAMTALILFAPPLLGLHDFARFPLFVIPGVLFALVLIGLGLRRLAPDLPKIPAVYHLGLDMLAWGIFIALTGGATNPVVSLLLPFVAIGAAVLPERQAWALGGWAVALYAALWQFFLPLPIRDEGLAVRLHLMGMGATFAVSVALAIWFISRLTRAVRQRDQALAEARERALRDDWVVSLGTLAAGAAHELSTPLSTLSILINERLDDAAIAPDLREDLELAAAQVATCKRALTQLTARAGQPRAEGDLAGAPMDRSAQPAGLWLRGMAEAWISQHPRADITLALDQSLDAQVVAHDLALERAVYHLVDNAVLASPVGIRVEARCEGEWLWVRILDQGPGVSAAQGGLPRPSGRGLGIGLLLTRGTVERLGGELTLTSEESGGTWATLKLPLARIAVGT